MDIFLRTIVSFFVLFIMTRLLGKSQISQLTFFNYVAGITIGSTTAEIIVAENITLIQGTISLVTWTLLTILLSIISLKSPKARVILDGEPSIVIKNGKILEKTLSRLRLNMDDLTMLLRNQNVFSIADVDYAIFEPNGQLSVLHKQAAQHITKKDMNVPVVPPLYLPTELIVDGRIVLKNLAEVNLTEEWLTHRLLKRGVNSVADVFYAELQSDGSLFIEKRK